MVFTTTELNLIYQKGKGKNTVHEIALALNKSRSQVYRALRNLDEKSIIQSKRNSFELMKNTHTNLLVNNLLNHPNLIDLLSGASILILQECLVLTTITEIANKTSLNESTIYNWINKYQKVSIVRKINKQYLFNDKLWDDLKSFIVEFNKFNDAVDKRISPSSKIYYKDKDVIIFSSKKIEDASFTAFSAYKDFGVDILTTRNYYCLPARKHDLVEVFIHSLYVAEKENNFRNLMFVTLFYLKNKSKLNKVNHVILSNIKKTLEGKKVEEYPTLLDIKGRAKMYDIEI